LDLTAEDSAEKLVQWVQDELVGNRGNFAAVLKRLSACISTEQVSQLDQITWRALRDASSHTLQHNPPANKPPVLKPAGRPG
jgi:hypothetical protein